MALRVPTSVFAAVLLAAAALVAGDVEAQPQAVQVKVGGKTAVTVANISRVAVGDPEVADIRVARAGEVEITGRASGTTQMHVWKADGQKVTFTVTVSR